MDIKNLNSYNASLLDYLGKGKTNNYFDSAAQNILSAYANGKNAASEASDPGINITLSEEAQALLAAGTDANSKLTGYQKNAADFMMSFFDQGGIDFENLSGEVLDIIEGLQGVIGGVTAKGRDVLTDAAEARYSNGAKKAYTLVGDGQRLRVGIEYTEDGKPSKLSITDITDGQVETADITIAENEDGTMRLNIQRTQRAYQNGHMTDLDPIESLSIKLYAT